MWNKLSMKEKAAMIKVAVNNGILNLDEIKNTYNKFDEGGSFSDEHNDNISNKRYFFEDWFNKRQKQLSNVPVLKDKSKQENYLSNLDTVKEYYNDNPLYREVHFGDVGYNREDYPLETMPENNILKDHLEDPRFGGAYNSRTHTIGYNDPTDTHIIHERTHALGASPQELQINYKQNSNIEPLENDTFNYNYLNNGYSHDVYLDNNREIYARLMQLRHDYGLDPTVTYTAEDLRKLAEETGHGNYDILDRYSDEFINFLLNDVAYNNIDYTNNTNYAAYGGYINKYNKHSNNKYAEGGPINSDSTTNDSGFLGLNGEEWLDIGTSMIPIYGTYKDAKEFYNDPSWENAMWLGISAISEVPFLKWVKAGKIAKAGKAVDKAVEVAEKYSKVKKKVDRMREIPNINPSRVRRASGEAGRLHLEMLKTTGEALQAKEAAKYFSLFPETSITAGAIADYVQALTNDNNQYAEGGSTDSWKPWYWFTKEYDAPSLKDALFQAYSDGKEGDNILYKGKAYKVALNDADKKEWAIKRQHELNRNITNEDVVDSYMNNVLYTMENPTNKGFRDGKYYPYADSSSPKNLGPGINYTSDVGQKLDFSGKKGYTKEELNEVLRPDLLAKMADIMTDLHDMYKEDADTMSMGNRQILLDTSHNVRPRGRKRANMPKAWPSLVKGMMNGDTKAVYKNTYSGSKRRQLMKNDLMFQNFVDQYTVKNR